MPHKLSSSLRSVAASNTTTPLTPDQKNFNRLIKQIETRRTRLTDWNDVIPLFRHDYARDLHPLFEQEMELKGKLAERLDGAYDQEGLTKRERDKLSQIIIDLVLNALEFDDQNDALKALYNKHSRSDFDEEESDHLDFMRAMLEESLGVDLGGDVDLRSPEAVFEKIQEQIHAQEELGPKRKPRKKSAKQEAKEQFMEEESQQLKQSIREIYRKLASALHPDREADPHERERKTMLMQRANEAYQRGALLELLELQLELEHIDSAHLATITGDRIKHYIKILKEQLFELDSEVQRIEHGIMMEFGLSPYKKLSPGGLMSLLVKDVAKTKTKVLSLQSDIDMTAEPKRLKAWLRGISHQPSPSTFDFGF
jgi:signal transduction histidine kinase